MARSRVLHSQHALVAQWREQRFPKPRVAGSIPAEGTLTRYVSHGADPEVARFEEGANNRLLGRLAPSSCPVAPRPLRRNTLSPLSPGSTSLASMPTLCIR